jgi:hypothetical protein
MNANSPFRYDADRPTDPFFPNPGTPTYYREMFVVFRNSLRTFTAKAGLRGSYALGTFRR